MTMKTGWLILVVAALIAFAAFITMRVLCGTNTSAACAACAVCDSGTGDATTSLAWVKRDFQLSDAEFQKVCALHDAYLPQCDAMCQRMTDSGTRLSSLLQSSTSITPESEAALREYESLRAECQRATLHHLTETAAVMKPEAGRAFMHKVLPHLLTARQHVAEVTR